MMCRVLEILKLCPASTCLFTKLEIGKAPVGEYIATAINTLYNVHMNDHSFVHKKKIQNDKCFLVVPLKLLNKLSICMLITCIL